MIRQETKQSPTFKQSNIKATAETQSGAVRISASRLQSCSSTPVPYSKLYQAVLLITAQRSILQPAPLKWHLLTSKKVKNLYVFQF